MTAVFTVVLAASTVKAIGSIIAVITVLGVAVYALFNIRAGRSEIGAEIEIAPNLKPYYDDEELENRKLDRVLTLGLAGLVLVGVGLPAYWLGEPGRHSGAEEDFAGVFVGRGEELYTVGAQCNACHGAEGSGGVVQGFTLLDANNEFVAQVDWKAPALNTALLRFDREELFYIIDNGRAWTPMPAWGENGGGPLTTQQINNLIDYIESIQITPEASRAAVENQLRKELGLADGDEIDYGDLATGEALFNLGQTDGFAGGAYACGRCHTRGWSIDPGSAQPAGADISAFVDYANGGGAFGPILRNVIPRIFADETTLAEFISMGSERGVQYGLSGGGDGNMPGFGDNPNTEEVEADGMLSPEMIEALAHYVASLTDAVPDGADTEEEG